MYWDKLSISSMKQRWLNGRQCFCCESILESRWNDSISFQGGNEDIETPEKDKNSGGHSLYWLGSSQFSANCRVTTHHQNHDGKEGLNTKDGDGKSQASDGHVELVALGLVINSSHWPCDTNTQENVDSVWASNVTNWGISSFILNSSSFTGEGVGYRSAKSYKSNGIYGVLEENETAQMACNVTNDGSTTPIMAIETTKHGYPLAIPAGGMKEKITFQNRVKKCMM